LKEEGRVNPLLVREETGLGKGDINTALTNFRAAGWVRRVTRGLYEFVDDPRDAPDRRDRDGTRTGTDVDVGADDLPPVAAMEFGKDVTDRRLEVIEEWLAFVRDEGQVQKSDFEDWYTEDHQTRTGYEPGGFWDFFAKPALRQADAVEQPNSRTYVWGGDHA